MKINNSAELAELIQQAILLMKNQDSVILIREDANFSDFEKQTFFIAETLWHSFERGVLDISDPYAPSNIDMIDYLSSILNTNNESI